MMGIPNTKNIKQDENTGRFIIYCTIRKDYYELMECKTPLQAIRERDKILKNGGFEQYLKNKNRLKHHHKHYYKRNNKYVISKLINGKQQTYGTYDTESEAKAMVKILWKYDWDKDKLPDKYKEMICRKPRYYTYTKGKYQVSRQNKGYGAYETEQEAQAIVEELKKADWNIELLPAHLQDKLIKKPKYYTYNKGKYTVQKTINGVHLSFGSYSSESEAKEIVQLLKKVNWDITKLSSNDKKKLSFLEDNYKNYTYDKSKDKYNVYKTFDKKCVVYAKLDTEQQAIMMVEELKKVEWDKDKLPVYYRQLLVRQPKHYGYNKKTGKWRVYKQINGKYTSFGEYISESKAKGIVEKLIANNWNKECILNG